jgi:predicted metal-binding protein
MAESSVRDVKASWSSCVLVCAHERDPALGRAYCGAAKGSELRQWLKDRVKAEGLRGQVLVVKTGCLGICSDHGITVAVIPEAKRRELVVFPAGADKAKLWATITGKLQ